MRGVVSDFDSSEKQLSKKQLSIRGGGVTTCSSAVKRIDVCADQCLRDMTGVASLRSIRLVLVFEHNAVAVIVDFSVGSLLALASLL